MNDGEIVDHDVRIGPTNNDEMCNFYLMYWVEGERPMAIEQVCKSQVCLFPHSCLTKSAIIPDQIVKISLIPNLT